ncbi:MAG: metal ABC transporter permease [Oscillospiraceae bacterium]|nr:metal ABC transporter permease [Oscillospiraceae bacterium]
MSDTMNVWETLVYYFQFPLVRYAMIVGLLIALCSSLLGVTLVLKRFSFIGDGLSHVAFGAMAVAGVLGVTNDMAVVLPLTVLSAVLLLRTGQNTKIKGDAAIAMISVGALAIGYLLMNLFPRSSNISTDVCTTLFGSTSILTLTVQDVWLCVIMALIVITVFLLFYHKIFAITFDENFASATGVKSNAYNLLIAVITALIIVLAMNLVGSLLISALIIFPALSAMRVFKSFRSVIICSALISVICAAAGIILSILYGTPVGSTIVAADILVFFIFCLYSFLISKFPGRKNA